MLKSFGNLKVRLCFVCLSTDIDLLNQVDSAPSEKMKLALPTHFETHGRVCFYGFDVTREWLIDYARTHWKDAEKFDDSAKVSTAIKFLRRHSRIKSLVYESALVDSTAPVGTANRPGHRPGEFMVPLLSIFSDERSSYKRRPTQAEVDHLSQIMGGKQPRWWIDYEDPRTYE
jgi:hypothetical protein